MTEQELRAVVEGPAEMAGLQVENELTDLVVQDVAGHAGGLPLLSTALASTWERRRGEVLTLAGYLANGGVAGAVAGSAEAVFASFDEEGKEIARQVLIRLADQDEQGTLRGRRMPLSELAPSGAHRDATRAVVETLTARRLVATEDGYLEIAHEALLGAWPRLAGWLADDAVGRSVRRHVAPAAVEWDRNGRPMNELYRGARLDAAADWAASPQSGVSELEKEFLDAGVARSTAQLAEARGRGPTRGSRKAPNARVCCRVGRGARRSSSAIDTMPLIGYNWLPRNDHGPTRTFRRDVAALSRPASSINAALPRCV